ncbi:MAG: YopJ family acetyltransferase [Pseudomonadota bacterium]
MSDDNTDGETFWETHRDLAAVSFESHANDQGVVSIDQGEGHPPLVLDLSVELAELRARRARENQGLAATLAEHSQLQFQDNFGANHGEGSTSANQNQQSSSPLQPLVSNMAYLLTRPDFVYAAYGDLADDDGIVTITLPNRPTFTVDVSEYRDADREVLVAMERMSPLSELGNATVSEQLHDALTNALDINVAAPRTIASDRDQEVGHALIDDTPITIRPLASAFSTFRRKASDTVRMRLNGLFGDNDHGSSIVSTSKSVPRVELSNQHASASPPDEFDIAHKAFTDRFNSLNKKNSTGIQDRTIDIDIAPIYLEVLNRQFPSADIVRLDSPTDLVLYAYQEYQKRDPLSPPIKKYAVLSVDDGTHDLAVEIYMDRRGISILTVDSLDNPTKAFKKVEDELKAAVANMPGPIRAVEQRSTRVQKTSFGCDFFAYHAIKQLIKHRDAITPVHDHNLAAAVAQGDDTILFKQVPDARKILPLSFQDPTQQRELLNDLPGGKSIVVTQKSGREETAEKRAKRVFQEMEMGHPNDPKQRGIVNTSNQRLRTRTFRGVVNQILHPFRNQPPEERSAQIQNIVAANTPLRPANWAESIPSWLTPDSDDKLKGPLVVLRNAEERLKQMPPENRADAICEVLTALPQWQSSPLRITALRAAQQTDFIPSVDVERVLDASLAVQKKLAKENTRPDSNDLNRIIVFTTQKLWRELPTEKIVDFAARVKKQSLEKMITTDMPGQRESDLTRTLKLLEVINLHEIDISPKSLLGLNVEVSKIANSKDSSMQRQLIDWYAKTSEANQKMLQPTFEACIPEMRVRSMSGEEHTLETQQLNLSQTLIADTGSAVQLVLQSTASSDEPSREFKDLYKDMGLAANKRQEAWKKYNSPEQTKILHQFLAEEKPLQKAHVKAKKNTYQK